MKNLMLAFAIIASATAVLIVDGWPKTKIPDDEIVKNADVCTLVERLPCGGIKYFRHDCNYYFVLGCSNVHGWVSLSCPDNRDSHAFRVGRHLEECPICESNYTVIKEK